MHHGVVYARSFGWSSCGHHSLQELGWDHHPSHAGAVWRQVAHTLYKLHPVVCSAAVLVASVLSAWLQVSATEASSMLTGVRLALLGCPHQSASLSPPSHSSSSIGPSNPPAVSFWWQLPAGLPCCCPSLAVPLTGSVPWRGAHVWLQCAAESEALGEYGDPRCGRWMGDVAFRSGFVELVHRQKRPTCLCLGYTLVSIILILPLWLPTK